MTKFKDHKANYHTHNWLCRHAKGNGIDYVKEAIKHNFTVLGISDHAPFEILSGYRMELSEFYDIYLHELEEGIEYGKNHGLTVYKGLEMEYFDGYDNHYHELLSHMDYMILGQHYIPKNNHLGSVYSLKTLEDIKIYADQVIKGLRSGYFSLLCHPDICFWGIKNPTDEMYEALRPVIKECVKLDIPIEINANGIRRVEEEDGLSAYNYENYKYPRPKLWKIVAEEGGTAIIESDAHDPKVLNDFAIEIGYQFAKDMGVKVITELSFKENKYKKRGCKEMKN
jgi:histidinol-phosphatase (PHP family)